MDKPYLNLVGLAFRAGKCIVGEENIIKGIQKRQVHLLLIALDCGPTTKKRLTDKCTTYAVPYMEADRRDILGQAIGKSERVAIAITDRGFATGIQNKLS